MGSIVCTLTVHSLYTYCTKMVQKKYSQYTVNVQ